MRLAFNRVNQESSTSAGRRTWVTTSNGTYYIAERDLVKQNHDAIVRCIKLDGVRAVKRIVEISDSGRAPKNDPAVFALALIAAPGADPL